MASIGGQRLEAARICTRTPLPTVKAADRSRCCELHWLRAGGTVTTAYSTRELAYRTDRTHAPVSRRSSRGARRFSAILPPAAANIGWARRAGPKDSWADRASKRSERARCALKCGPSRRADTDRPRVYEQDSCHRRTHPRTPRTGTGTTRRTCCPYSGSCSVSSFQRADLPVRLHCPTTGQPPRAWMDDPEPCMCVAS